MCMDLVGKLALGTSVFVVGGFATLIPEVAIRERQPTYIVAGKIESAKYIARKDLPDFYEVKMSGIDERIDCDFNNLHAGQTVQMKLVPAFSFTDRLSYTCLDLKVLP